MVVFVQNATSTTGAGLTGVTYNASGLVWYWYSETSGTSSAVSLANQTIGTWTSGGFIQVDATHLPGFYEIGIPNALLTGTTPTWVTMQLAGATNMVPVNLEIELTGFNPALNTFTSTVVGGTINTVTGTVTATVPGAGGTNVNVVEWLGTAVTSAAGVPVVYATNTVPANVTAWLGTAVTSNAGVPLVDVNAISGTVTATVVGGTIATVTNPVTLSTGQLTVKRDQALAGFTFPMYNATSGAPATGLSVSCTITRDGGSLVSSANSPTEIGSGIYSLNLAASDLNGTTITLVFVASGASATIVTLITQA